MLRLIDRRGVVVLAALVCWLPACAAAPPPANPADVSAVVESFYGAMKAGDAAGVMRVIAPDAVFLEVGRLETRAEYEKNHLPADIEFESQVTGTRGPLQVTIEGNTAWVIGTTEFAGMFKGAAVDFISVQLMVLSRESGTWLIRSAHWSSRRRQ